MPLGIVFMFLISLLFTSIGTVFGSVLQDMQGTPLIMNFLVMPLFFFSSALFRWKVCQNSARELLKLNPLTYGVDGSAGRWGMRSRSA